MSIEGQVSVSAIFHDKFGDDSLKVAALSSAEAYSTGKVAIIEGTCGTSAVTIATAPSTYVDAAGEAVTFSSVTRIVVQGTPGVAVEYGSIRINSISDAAAASSASGLETLTVASTAGTSSYTLIVVGE